MKFSLIDEEKTHHKVSRTSGVLGSSRAGYYASKKNGTSKRRCEDERLKVIVAEIHKSSFGTYGAPRIHQELAQAHGIHVGKKRVARLMRELQIEGVSRRKKRKRSKDRAEMPAFPDLVRRDFSATRPDELWVADITYVPTWEGWLYLAAVVDVFTRRCCGWSMRNDLTADLVIDALGMAVTLRRPEPGTIHHSGRGSQYGSLSFGKKLRESGITPSMGSKGDPYDNACAESFFATLKTELIRRARFRTRDEARLSIFRYIEGFYNPRRRHSALGYKSPAEYERMFRSSLEERAGDPILSR